jgi:hypothetical protein
MLKLLAGYRRNKMNGDVHPWVTKQSQAEANAEFDRALDLFEHVVGINSEGRFRTYRATLSQVFCFSAGLRESET